MLNKAPIFLNCFSRGGSNIFWNMFLTHPDVCSPIRETLEIFGMGLRGARVEGYLVAFLSGQSRLFDQWHLNDRRPIPKFAQKYIDRTFYNWKLKTFSDVDMKYKYEDEVYTLEEVKSARLVTKNNNGLAFLSDIFLEMYPDATFFALVRNPIALYESHKRRKIAKSVEQFARSYQKIAERMIRDEARFENYHIVRFEDLLVDPLGSMRKLYDLASLDFDKIKKIRFKAKPHFQSDGQHATQYTAGQHYWFELENIYGILEPNINEYHMHRLGDDEKERLLELVRKSIEYFGYVN